MYGWNWIRMNGFLNLSVNIPLTCLFRVFLTKLFKPSFPTGNGSTSMNKQQLIQFPFQNSSSSIQTLNSIPNKSFRKILSWKGSFNPNCSLSCHHDSQGKGCRIFSFHTVHAFNSLPSPFLSFSSNFYSELILLTSVCILGQYYDSYPHQLSF